MAFEAMPDCTDKSLPGPRSKMSSGSRSRYWCLGRDPSNPKMTRGNGLIACRF
jgi:hypothetical protein